MRGRLHALHRKLVRQGPQRPWEWLLMAALLIPSMLFGAAAWLRGKGYDLGLLPVYRAAVPVISVGNLAAGGTGKTPAVDWLVKWATRQGHRPAVVSRGYGGSFRGRVGVVAAGNGLLMSPRSAGDEPCLLVRRNPTAIVLVARKRALGVHQALAEHGADLVILDDGFQHRAVARDLDLVLVDGTSPYGNGLPLPAGLLREFPSALRRADLILKTRVSGELPGPDLPRPAWQSRHCLAPLAIPLAGEPQELSSLSGLRLLALAGIAEPEGFFSGLEGSGLRLEKRLALADHTQYNDAVLQRIQTAAQGLDAIVTTEKDGVKLSAEMFGVPCYQVPLQLAIEDEESLDTQLHTYLWSPIMTISDDLMSILACPKCKQPVTLAEDGSNIDCPACRLHYPVRDGIPVMLIDEAESY